ncbi:MAG: response regulator [Chitinispirillaceae bacterium]|nr:response regulator [Chitinispirillaceae bacterium]
MNILIADDSKMIRHMAITALNELGYDSITEASNVGEAKNLLKGKKFDLIISDWHMPGESGLDFLKYVKSCPEYAALPFILQTTENEKKNIFEAVKAGVQGYLFKPVQKNALAQKMLELSKVYHFKPPSAAMPLREAPVTKPAAAVAPKTEKGISALLHSDFASELTKQDFGYSCEIKSGGTTPLSVCIGNDAYRQFPKILHDRYPDAVFVFIADSQTGNNHGESVRHIVKDLDCFQITVPEGANNRTVAQYGTIVDALSEKAIDSSAVIIAFGDMPLLGVAGFAAATYKAGIRFVTVPLSLKDFLDSSVGELWIIDGTQSRRIAGLYHDPSMTWFDCSSLGNMSDFVAYTYTCAEFFRYAFFGGKELMETMTVKWEQLLKKDVETIAECARLCIAARASIRCMTNIENISRDAVLHFAQPLAEALVDSCTKAVLNPGQALFRAIACMCEAAKQSGMLASSSFDTYIKLLQKMPAFQMPELLNPGKVFQKAFGPEAHDFGRTVVAMPSAAGSVVAVKDVPEAVFHDVLKSLLSISKDPNGKK